MLVCVDRLREGINCSSSSTANNSNPSSNPGHLDTLSRLIGQSQFQQLLRIHNTIQSAQCFQCPPMAMCCDSRALVQEV